ncbi:MAG: glycosyltransferase family 2 protein [Devosia sp.]|nr:glycosyltransferase family 2 protein [Devosia sp.]
MKDVSVIFSSYNGARRLVPMLDSLIAQDLPQDRWELIAVDNNSSDGTFDILDSYRSRLPITVLRHPVPGKSAALNSALEHLGGDLVVLTDDDIVAEPGWLSALVACAVERPEFGVFGGRIMPNWEADPNSRAFLRWIPMGSTFAVIEDTQSGPCDPNLVWGPNTAIRRSWFAAGVRYREDIGPLPGGVFAMGEDLEIVLRLARQGARTYRCAEAVVHHFVPASSMTEEWVQRRAERLGYGMPAVFPERVPSGPRLGGVPFGTWVESAAWVLRSAVLSPLPSSRLRFWAIWKRNYMRGYRAGIRRFASATGAAR